MKFYNKEKKLSYTYYFFIVKAPTFTSSPMPQSVQLKDTAKFTCSTTGYKVKYKWTSGSGSFRSEVTGINTNTLVIPDVKSTDDNTYTCTISNVGGKTTSAPAKLTVTGMLSKIKQDRIITVAHIRYK